MNTKLVVGMLAGILVMIGVMQTQADTFINPPETNAPVWYTAFPYQRNIHLQFAVNPVSPPGSGIPGAVYEGTLDKTLLDSDYVTLDNVAWFPIGTAPGGSIGIDNSQGTDPLTGTALFHVDNTEDPNLLKNVWLEIGFNVGQGGSLTTDVQSPSGVASLIYGRATSSLLNEEWQIQPNPLWENIAVAFTAPAGGYAFINDFHVATECIPEPSTLTLLCCMFSAIGGFALFRRRR